MIFNPKKISHYLITIGIILTVSTFANKLKASNNKSDEEELIRNYLLNESPLYGYNRPKLWIHSTYEINARKWKDFHSRNTNDLNQPYIHHTIKSIINHCGNDFNVCLIDDESFSKLLPSWDVDVASLAEPIRHQMRELGMAQLLYVYGGMVVPNTFVCTKSLAGFYMENINNGKPFVCETVNRTLSTNGSPLFVPSTYFMGANKNDHVMSEMVEYIKHTQRSGHISSETDVMGALSKKCSELIANNQMNLVGGERIGIKTNDKKPVLLEDLLEEAHLDLYHGIVGIYIPGNEIIKRSKYQWFSVMPIDQLTETNMIIVKYLLASSVDCDRIHQNEGMNHMVVSI